MKKKLSERRRKCGRCEAVIEEGAECYQAGGDICPVHLCYRCRWAMTAKIKTLAEREAALIKPKNIEDKEEQARHAIVIVSRIFGISAMEMMENAAEEKYIDPTSYVSLILKSEKWKGWEIGKLLGQKDSTVWSRLKRARSKLRVSPSGEFTQKYNHALDEYKKSFVD